MREIKWFAFIGLIGATLLFCLGPFKKIEAVQKRPTRWSTTDSLLEGDIVFQTSLSGQGLAIKLATHSEYTHCGIVFKKNKEWYVYEALQPVKSTPLLEWIKRGENNHFVVKRLKNAGQVLTAENIINVKAVAEKYIGKNYDLFFEWSDERIYCSELVWKTYKEALGLTIGKLQKLREFDLNSAPVKQKLKERFGDKVPLDEQVISPASIFHCELLRTVATH